MRNKLLLAFICLLAMASSSCTFVKLSTKGQEVRVANSSDVAGCKKVGRATVSVLYKFGFIPRSDEAVASNLETLGKNSAADLNGDTIVSTGRPNQGNETFDVYRCRQ